MGSAGGGGQAWLHSLAAGGKPEPRANMIRRKIGRRSCVCRLSPALPPFVGAVVPVPPPVPPPLPAGGRTSCTWTARATAAWSTTPASPRRSHPHTRRPARCGGAGPPLLLLLLLLLVPQGGRGGGGGWWLPPPPEHPHRCPSTPKPTVLLRPPPSAPSHPGLPTPTCILPCRPWCQLPPPSAPPAPLSPTLSTPSDPGLPNPHHPDLSPPPPCPADPGVGFHHRHPPRAVGR